MPALVLVLSFLTIVASAHAARAGLSTTPREMSASNDAATVSDEANQQTEDQIHLTKAKRREVQRTLTKLGFDTKATGKFDDSTRAAVARWQEERGYRSTGFLDPAQHKALLSESVAATEAGKSSHPERHRARAHYSRGIGGPISAVGGAVGGAVHGVVGALFRR